MSKNTNPNFIGIYDNALSERQCVQLIQYFEDYPNKTPGGFYSNSFQRLIVNKEKKDSTDITLNFFNKSSTSVTIREALTKGTKQYREDYPACDIMSFWDVYSGYKIQKYLPGQGFHQVHCESGSKGLSNRVLVWMIYLNTITDGGETRFPAYDLNVKAEVGKLLIWPAGFTHIHHGLVSETQTKYIATGWYTFTD